MSVKAKLEAVIYATEEPVTLNQLATLLHDAVLAELATEEAARLALNQTISDGQPALSDEVDELRIAEGEAIIASSAESEQRVSLDSGPEPQDEKKEEPRQVKAYLKKILDELAAEYAARTHGVEVRQVAGGYHMATKPEHHDVVVAFAKSLKPPVRLSMQALETLAVIAYKQPVTAPEISEIRGVDSSGVLATLLDRKLITTAGRKQVIGRPILYKTTKEFLLRFGLNNVSELPSIEEFEKLGDPQTDLFNASPALEAPTSELEDPSAESSSQAAVAVAGEAQSAEEASQSRHNQQKQS